VAALLFAAVPAAHADNAGRGRIPAKARELADRGRAYHETGEYREAVSAFKEAYVLAPSPGLLFNIAQSYRLAGNCDESAWMYRRFLDTEPIPEHRVLAERHLASVQQCGSGGLRLAEPPRLDVEVPDPAPRPTAIAKRVPRDNARGTTLKRYGVGAAIGGGVALAGAAVLALDARDAERTVAETYRLGGKWADVADDDARGRRSAAMATVIGIGGGLAVASGMVLYAVGRHHEKARHVAVTPTAGGAQVSMSWGF
jgi:tetratricopeptide (TPR) repeat protein